MTMPPDVIVLADHSVLLAIPAFAPAVVVAGVVVYVAMRDRRRSSDAPHRDGISGTAGGENPEPSGHDESP
jgi:hypothetical protein